MYLQYLILLPIVLAAASAIVHKVRRARYVEAGILLGILCVVGVNAVATMFLYGSEQQPVIYSDRVGFFLFQGLLSCFIVPALYVYFSQQTGRPLYNPTTITLLSLIALMAVPNLCVDLSYTGSGGGTYDVIQPHCLCIFSGGHNIFHFPIENIVVLLQTAFVVRRLVIYGRQMKRYELRYSLSMTLFFAWSVACVVFVVVYNSIPYEMWNHNSFAIVYCVACMLLGCVGFTGIAMNMDLHPILTLEEKEHVQMDNFIQANRQLAQKMRELLQDDSICMRQGLVIDDMVAMLGTNRTYFTRMMRAEFGMSFTDYIHQVRVERCKTLLETTDDSLEDIALATGFGSASNLSRVFKKLTQTTPDAYRVAHKPDTAG